MTKLPGDRLPALIVRQIQDNVVAVVTVNEKTWGRNRPPITQRSELDIFFIALHRNDIERQREMQLRFHELMPDYRPHLFQPEQQLLALIWPCVSKHRKMRRAEADPFRFVGGKTR